jgi:replicative superfamily II helicase
MNERSNFSIIALLQEISNAHELANFSKVNILPVLLALSENF